MYKVFTSDKIATIKRIGLPVSKDWRFRGFGWVSQGFGQNLVDFYKTLGMKGHNGIDFAVPTGTDCFACFDGKVIVSGVDETAGREVRIESLEFEVEGQKLKLEAVYYHLKEEFVKVGDFVKLGQKIAKTNNTGRWTTGAHLHFGIKPVYKDESGYYFKDNQNGYFGCIDPAPLFYDEDFKLVPVDNRYGMPKSKLIEIGFDLTSKFWLEKKLGRKLNQQEYNALVYGNWDFGTVAEPTYYPIWIQDTRAQYRKKMLEMGINPTI